MVLSTGLKLLVEERNDALECIGGESKDLSRLLGVEQC